MALARAALVRLRVQLIYVWRHRRLARIGRPERFTEWVQHRKLHDRDPRLPILADKLLAKRFVAERLGAAWVIPTLWAGHDLPEQPPWSVPFVVKSRHGCNQIAFVRAVDERWEPVRRRAARWLTRRYGGWLDEWAYRGIAPGLLVEPFVGENGVLPLDYKLFVFGGVVRFIQVHLERETRHRWLLFDRDWRQLTPSADTPARPASLPAMIAGAEALAAGFDFVRVDLYEIAGQPRFGEFTFYPGSGLHAISPPELDQVMGDYWRASKDTA